MAQLSHKRNDYTLNRLSISISHLEKIKIMQNLVIKSVGEENIVAEQFSSLSYEFFLKSKPEEALLQELHSLFF